MKKLFSLLSALLIVLSSCDSNRGKSISDYPDANMGDSLLFYYMKMRAHEYWEEAENDTTLRNPEARKKFLEGVAEGLEIAKNDDKYYSYGVQTGMQMALNILKFEKMYDVRLDRELALESLSRGLDDAEGNNEIEYQNNFYKILDRMKSMQRSKDHEKAKMSLIEEARGRNMTKLSDDLYYKIMRKGSGPYASTGNSAYVKVNYDRADGVDFALPSPEFVTIGAPGIPDVLNRAYVRLNKGSVVQFATTAESLFGSRTYVMGLKPESVIIVTITLNEIVSPHEENNAQNNADSDGDGAQTN